jgi:hypothetical protein
MLFLIDLSTRRVEIAGIATKANRLWMDQVARNLCDDGDGFLTGKRYPIHDRDPRFMADFLETLAVSGVKSGKLPPRSPNLNAHAERFVRTIQESCLGRMILFGEGSLRRAMHEFVGHCHDHPGSVACRSSRSDPAPRAAGRDAELPLSAGRLREEEPGSDSMVTINRSAGGGRSLRRSVASRGDLNRTASFCGRGWRRFEFLDGTPSDRETIEIPKPSDTLKVVAQS